MGQVRATYASCITESSSGCLFRYPFLFGAIQVVEADPSQADRVVGAMWKFVQLANAMLHNGEGLEEWGQSRWEEFVLNLQWWVYSRPLATFRLTCLVHFTHDRLYENYPNGQEDLLLDMMQKLKSTGSPWEDIFAETVSPWSIRPTV